MKRGATSLASKGLANITIESKRMSNFRVHLRGPLSRRSFSADEE
jgi:hypothetical protein